MNETPAKMSNSDRLRHLNPRWEWSAEEIRRVGYRVVDMIAQHLTTLPEKPSTKLLNCSASDTRGDPSSTNSPCTEIPRR